jgi:REP element-mobilizing transposase RayT
MHTGPPHSRVLRKGRFSAPGHTYFLTANTAARQPRLVPAARSPVIDALNWSRQQGRLWLMGYVVMDNHFHALITLRAPAILPAVLHSVKGHTARQINRLAAQSGTVWQPGYHDHLIRDEADFWHYVGYMHDNPVRRGWVTSAADYAWSTAHPSRAPDLDWGQWFPRCR